MQPAMVIIKEEHRALAAVVHGMAFLVAELGKGNSKPDFPLFRAMLHYITGFPDRLHHPKEDRYLFRALRRRAPETEALLAQLESEHREGPADAARLALLLDSYERGGAAAFPPFAEAVNAYVDATFRHMATEEGKVMPLAMRVLTAEDWHEINTAFAANNDPMLGIDTQNEFRGLFARILALAPAPIGLG